jgi:hypothetical protein
MKLIETKILFETQKPYWEDETKIIIDRIEVSKYEKDNFIIELTDDYGLFTHKMDDKIKHKVIVKIFDNGNLVKRRLYWLGYDINKDFSNEELIEKTFKLLNSSTLK